MDDKNFTGTVPEHYDGKIINAESTKAFERVDYAIAAFAMARQRMLDVNNWNNIATGLLADFQLTDPAGQAVSGSAKEGYYFRIDIPGPGSDTGDGYDWALVEAIDYIEKESVQSIALRVRPASNPTNNSTQTAHFYASEGTSTFTVTRENRTITTAIHDRNIKVNESSEHLLDRARNMAVGAIGRMFFSKVQWELLTTAWIG